MNWIYCTDRLPENSDDVLVTVKRGSWVFVSIDSYNKRQYGGWLNYDGEDGYNVIAWTELPEPAERR